MKAKELKLFKVTAMHRPEDKEASEYSYTTHATDTKDVDRTGREIIRIEEVKPNAKQRERLEAINDLRAIVPPGTTVYTILRHVSQSGMYRAIDVYIMQDNQPMRITWGVSKAIQEKYDRRHEALGVGGCGMDMGFSVVYNLSRSLYPNGFKCVGKGCPSNDHSNRQETKEHHDGGYALSHRWM